MIRLFIAVLLGAFSTAMPAMAGEVTAEALAAIDKVLADIGCKVEADDVDATGDGYEADDVECKDGEFEVTFDKDFKIKSKEKDEY
jgi:hypothetical protein